MYKTKVTKEQILQACNTSESMAAAAAKLPMNHKTFRKYAKLYGYYNPNPAGKGLKKNKPFIPLDDILNGKQPQYSTFKLKNRLLKENLLKPICQSCGLSKWLDGKIPLELDHIDGNSKNHSFNNLRLLCPNCHALTPTYRAKNRKPPISP